MSQFNNYPGGLVIPKVISLTSPEQEKPKTVTDIRHPDYSLLTEKWAKWRLTYEAGDQFIDAYLKQFTKREDTTDFTLRKAVTPIPSFAKAALNDIKNSIFQRTVDITRDGGPSNYQKSMQGLDGGVNRRGGGMNWFIGTEIIPELLVLSKVGVFVDSPPVNETTTVADRVNKHPYLYSYKAEDILTWAWKTDSSSEELRAVLLRDWIDEVDQIFKLPKGKIERFRHLWIAEDGFVHVQYYNAKGDKEGVEKTLTIKKIPFVIFQISDSLMADVANYQIALLNLESSDMAFTLKSNFPFYVEEFDSLSENAFAKQPTPLDGVVTDCYTQTATFDGPEIKVGTVDGRRYPKGLKQPDFINPSTDPLKASMAKQEQLKQDIRMLVNLSLSNIKPRMASAESKAMDQTGLESGLSYIGLELEKGEREIAAIWAEYENTKGATVKYPGRYSLKTDEEERKEAEDLKAQLFTVASVTFQKEIVKRIAYILLGSKVSSQKLETIIGEIDAADVITADPEILLADMEASLLSLETASKARGYKPGEVAKAIDDHEARVMRIAKAQGLARNDPGARGVPEMSADPNASRTEKLGQPTRGAGDQNTGE